MSPRPPRRQQGQALAGAVLALAVTATLLGLLGLLVEASVRRSAEPEIARQALAIAEATLEEILARPLRDPLSGALCAPPPPLREDFDDVCDYDGLNEPAARGLAASLGTSPGAFALAVAVESGGLDAFHPDCGTPGRCARIRVEVTPPSGRPVALAAIAVDADA